MTGIFDVALENNYTNCGIFRGREMPRRSRNGKRIRQFSSLSFIVRSLYARFMPVYLEQKPVKTVHRPVDSWMWGLLAGALCSFGYLAAAGFFGRDMIPDPSGPVHFLLGWLAITPVNFFYTIVLLPIMQVLSISPSRVLFLASGVVLLLLVWSCLFHLVFPFTSKKLLTVLMIILTYALLTKALAISPSICVHCLQSSAHEYESDPAEWLKQQGR